MVEFTLSSKPKQGSILWSRAVCGMMLWSLFVLLVFGGLACSSYELAPESELPASDTSQVIPSPDSGDSTHSYDLSRTSDLKRSDNVSDYVESTNPLIRNTAVSLVQDSPADIEANSEIWKIWKINNWVANNISYVSDPLSNNYFAYAHETLQVKGGDCDDFAILLASMYEAVGLDAALAYIDTYGDGILDHMACLVYYPGDGDTFREEQEKILELVGLTTDVRFIYFDPVKSRLLPEKYESGIWIVADPTMALDKDKIGHIAHKPYQAVAIIDVGG